MDVGQDGRVKRQFAYRQRELPPSVLCLIYQDEEHVLMIAADDMTDDETTEIVTLLFRLIRGNVRERRHAHCYRTEHSAWSTHHRTV